MKKILWLTSWYPNSTDPFNGDFIKREAEAVSIYQPLQILHVAKFNPQSISAEKDYSDFHSRNQNLEEHILYYSSRSNERSVLSRYHSLKTYINRHLEFMKQLRKNDQWPDLIHVQVAMKAGLVALYLKWKYGVPYVLTEHWSGYYPVSKDSLYKKSVLTRFLTRLIIKHAARFLPVSEDLGQEISRHWIPVPFQKIPNVVNTNLFHVSEKKGAGVFRFIHISTLLYPKNPEGIIKAFVALLKQDIHAELILVGPLNPSILALIKASGLQPDQLIYTGEIPYEQVAVELRKSSALVMFSFYENMPCVVLEALCSGIPVIATRVGGISEIVGNENGILINPGKEMELLNAMKDMIRNYHRFDRGKISRDASAQFSYDVIGKKISDIYQAIPEKK
ncbi:MAG TPA: glycosyltransferase [Puia sp.]|jgi:glycosyltransferase involved in cell wall biosynthesis